ncbi:hypothetical protein [Kordiimonas sp.]|uniref:hypothetical protein n=1 Tax=Kordiimonas sp. TaxID=1970157 RepID=UPI003A91E648
MKLHQRKTRLQHRKIERCEIRAMSHEELTAKGRALGLPPFCGGWPTETLTRKIKESEANG